MGLHQSVASSRSQDKQSDSCVSSSDRIKPSSNGNVTSSPTCSKGCLETKLLRVFLRCRHSSFLMCVAERKALRWRKEGRHLTSGFVYVTLKVSLILKLFEPNTAVFECVLVAQSCPTPCDPMDCSPPGSFVHGVVLARILEWVAISSSMGSSPPRNWNCVSCVPSLQVDSLPTEPSEKP